MSEPFQASILWFLLQLVIVSAAGCLGVWTGHHVRQNRVVMLLVATFSLLIFWLVMHWYPALAVKTIPVSILSYIEGVGAVPAFMLLIGLVWAISDRLPRQKAFALAGMVIGITYFLHGSFWMLQSTPLTGLAQTTGDDLVMQSQDYSCVPAACATALNRIGQWTSESEMAKLTQTRVGSGATLVRAMDGIQRRLEGTEYRVSLLQPKVSDLLKLPMPMVTPMFFDTGRRHMVTLLRVEKDGVLVADPTLGLYYLPMPQFMDRYTGQVLYFEHIQPTMPEPQMLRHAAGQVALAPRG